MVKSESQAAKRTDIVVSQDELNLAEFPFCLLTSRAASERGSITVEREVFDPATGRTVRQKWMATGSAEHGLPTACDMDVYVALMQVAARDGIDQDRRIRFSRHELVRMQGLKPCQTAYDGLERSIKRLIGVKIHTEDAFFEAKTRRRTSTGFGILDNYKFEDSRCRVEAESGEDVGRQLEFHFHRSWVTLNNVLYEQLQRGGLKNLDTETYYSLEFPVSRRLYRFLDRMREKGASRYQIDLGELARLMPLHDARPSRQLRDLAKAHDELVEKGYLEKVDCLTRRKETRLIYAFAAPKLDANAQALVARGISPEVAQSLAARFPERIAGKVAAFDRRLREGKGKLESPAGYLRRAIENDWKEPPAVEPAAPVRPTVPAPSAEVLQARMLASLFAGLDRERQEEIDGRAEELAREELGPGANERKLQSALARKREEILLHEYQCEVRRAGGAER